MNGLIPISYLNDFLFCPYSIYLHQIYRATEEETVKAIPQKAGSTAHKQQETRSSVNTNLVCSLPVISESLGIYGIIDEFDTTNGTLTEYKNKLTAVFPGQRIQLNAQYFCLEEMGYPVKSIRLMEINTRTDFQLPLPGSKEKNDIKELTTKILEWNPEENINLNINKCRKCIYCSICEKTTEENVF